MKSTYFSLARIIAVTVVLVAASLVVASSPAGSAPPGGVLTAVKHLNPTLPTPKANGSCHVNGKLQDRNCTPGVADAAVTQANIHETICKDGYSDTVREQYAPESYTEDLKKLQIKEYGYTDTNGADYEEDHLISLELGGHPNDPRNLWPEYPHSRNPKDSVEDKLNKAVCAGTMTLADAQKTISTDWTKAQ